MFVGSGKLNRIILFVSDYLSATSLIISKCVVLVVDEAFCSWLLIWSSSLKLKLLTRKSKIL